MTTRDNVHPISDADLDAHRDDAEFRMQNVPMRGVSYDMLGELRKLPGVGGYLLSEPANRVDGLARSERTMKMERPPAARRPVPPAGSTAAGWATGASVPARRRKTRAPP